MLRRETAYKMAGRKHCGADTGAGMKTLRKLRLHRDDAARMVEVVTVLEALPGVQVEETSAEGRFSLRYSLAEHCLQDVEQCLRDAGLRLDDGVWARLRRWLSRYAEETRRHNLQGPQRLIKKYHQGYVKAYAQHEHGDHDDTPPEMRDYR